MNNAEFLIPITMFIVIGAVLVTWLFYRSKEKQMMIEKGMSYEQMMEFLKTKNKMSPLILLKLGIIVVCFSFGLGTGLLIDEYGGPEAWIPFLIFLSLGSGMILSFFAGKKYEDEQN